MAHVRRHPKAPGRWQVRYVDPDGRERSRNFATRVDADRYAATVTTDVLRGDYIDPAAGKVTVGEYARHWLQTRTHLAGGTQAKDRSIVTARILPMFANRPAAAVRPSQVAAWMAAMINDGLSRDYVRKAGRLLWAILEVARRDGAMKVNPAGDLETPVGGAEREGRALTDGDLARLWQAAAVYDEARRLPPPARVYGQLVVLGTCGLRWGEMAGLRRGDVDLAGERLHVRRSLSRYDGARPVKGRRSEDDGRTIPLPAAAVQALRDHMASAVVDLTGYVFTSPAGGPLRYSNWRRRVWLPVVEAAGLGDARPHDLRHTVATRLFVVDRWSPAEVQAFLGHRDPRTTLRIYAHVTGMELPRPSSATL